MLPPTKDEVYDLVKRIKVHTSFVCYSDEKEYEDEEKILLEEVLEMDRRAHPGLNLGRVLNYYINGMFRRYIVVSISEKEVKVSHLSLCGDEEGYKGIPSNGVMSKEKVETFLWECEGYAEIIGVAYP